MYNDYLKINKNFQTSINLQLDLNNEEKIKEYIPTSDICEVLKLYFSSFLGKEKSKSLALVGPYGKGKSFLLLVLIYLTSGNDKSLVYKKLLFKIGQIDSDLVEMINDFNKSQKKFLPVIINSNYNDLNQAFRIALDESLRANNLDNLAPHSTYKLCLNLIDEWQNDKELRSERLTDCLKKTKLSIDNLKNGLNEYSPLAFNDFKKLYRCITMGIEFNPLINDDINIAYTSTLHELISEKYTGIFLVFDEFSKFVDNSKNLMSDLKLVQDFAELANRTSLNEQINFCCVTHKSLNLYGIGNKKTVSDALKTVEGRFKEVKFNRSLDENYQIISGAIISTDKVGIIDKKINEDSRFYSEIKNSQIFDKNSDFKSLFKGCFPLNPITTISLIQLSEIVAQNERTLFTFLSDTDEYSFSSFIIRNDTGTLNNDSLYDYFSSLLQKDDSEAIRNIWFRTEATLSKISDLLERKIVKSLSILLIINDFGKLPPKDNIIALSLHEDFALVKSKLGDLISNHFLKQSLINGYVSFASSNSKEIDERVNLVLKTKIQNYTISQLADEANDNKFVLPRKYNEKNKITRYFRVCFLSEDELMNLNSFNTLFAQCFSDGLIINIIPKSFSSKHSIETIKSKVDFLNDLRVLVRLPTPGLDSYFEKSIRRLKALKEITDEELTNNSSSIIYEELKLLVNETSEEVNDIISLHYSSNSPFFAAGFEKTDFFDCLSKMMESEYSKYIIFNNELANKNTISPQYQKAVNHVVDWILSGEKDDDFFYTQTSPEATVRYSIVTHLENPKTSDVDFNNISVLKDKLLKTFSDSNGKEILVKSISSFLSKKPFGLRKGLHSLIISKLISSLNQSNVILRLQAKEIELTSENLNKAIYSTKDYNFTYSSRSKGQKDYLDSLLKMLSIKGNDNFRKDIYVVAEELRHFFVGLPKIIRNDTKNNEFLGIDCCILNYKDLFLGFNLNPFDVVLIEPQKLLSNSYEESFTIIRQFYTGWKTYLNNYKNRIILSIKEKFDIESTTNIKTGIDLWIKKNINAKGDPVLNDADKKVYDTFRKLSFDEEDNIEAISFASTGAYIEDWESDNISRLAERVSSIQTDLKRANFIDFSAPNFDSAISNIQTKSSPLGEMLKNSLQSTIDDYGDSVPKEEKIRIIAEIMKGLI